MTTTNITPATTTTTSPATGSADVARPTVSVRSALGTGAVAGIAAAVINVAISAVARGPFDASDDFAPLTPGPIVMWTLLGAILGAVGWRLFINRSARSRALLTKLVPIVLVLSFLPDLALLATDTMPGQTTPGVLALMVMHVATAAVVVTAYRRAMPPR
jgi:NADH:ubiquinone oxidoreductase subunit K